jgi:hypothetical protein
LFSLSSINWWNRCWLKKFSFETLLKNNQVVYTQFSEMAWIHSSFSATSFAFSKNVLQRRRPMKIELSCHTFALFESQTRPKVVK